jgi:dolichol kinase
MMMLIVFTVFFGMELKTAVGTSTFIMTFTALISSVSHVLIHPAIVLEKWDVLLVCIAAATMASLVSARFANRVRNRTVGLVTGAVLTLLGAAMLILNFWGFLSHSALFAETLRCFGVMAAFIVSCVLVVLPIRFFTKIPTFIFRKILHIVAFSGISLMILTAGSWQAAALTSGILALILYPVLTLIEKEPWYGRLFVQKKPGEIKKSMLMLFLMFTSVIAAAWGLFGKPRLAAAAILMWGTGDAAAALVGIPFGKHKVRSHFTDGKKSWEGSLAMFFVSFLAGLAVMRAPMTGLPRALLTAGIGALFGTVTELVSPSEYDTVSVPVVIAAVLLLAGSI